MSFATNNFLDLQHMTVQIQVEFAHDQYLLHLNHSFLGRNQSRRREFTKLGEEESLFIPRCIWSRGSVSVQP